MVRTQSTLKALLECTMISNSMDILETYKQTGAYLEGHFLLASGRHSPFFLQSTTVLQYPEHIDALGNAMAAKLKNELKNLDEIDFVIGPAMGGVTLAYVVAKALGKRALFAEKDGQGGMLVREALPIEVGTKFIAVEDVLTTGGSVHKAVLAAEAKGSSCEAVACIIDRGLSKLPETLPLYSLLTLEFPAFEASNCPLCDDDLELQEV